MILDRHTPDTSAAYPTEIGAECFINGYRAIVEKKTIPAYPGGEVEIIEVVVTADD